MPDSSFADRLRESLHRRSLSQRAVSVAVGVHETTVSGWIRGRMDPTRANIEALARTLDVDPAWLAFGTEDGDQSVFPIRPADETAVQALVRAGQEHLAAVSGDAPRDIRGLTSWLVEFSVQLLDAAATDARRQLGTLAESIPLVDLPEIEIAREPPPEGVTVEGAPPEVIAAAEQAVLAKAAELAARKGKGGHVPPGTNRSAG